MLPVLAPPELLPPEACGLSIDEAEHPNTRPSNTPQDQRGVSYARQPEMLELRFWVAMPLRRADLKE